MRLFYAVLMQGFDTVSSISRNQGPTCGPFEIIEHQTLNPWYSFRSTSYDWDKS